MFVPAANGATRLARCARDAEPVGKFVGNLEARFVSSLPDFLGLDPFEFRQELLLIRLRQAMVGRRKEADVFLADVLPEQFQ